MNFLRTYRILFAYELYLYVLFRAYFVALNWSIEKFQSKKSIIKYNKNVFKYLLKKAFSHLTFIHLK
jgi:hypothetical protein